MRRTYDVSRSAINRGRSRSYIQRQGLSLSQVWVQWSIRRTGSENNRNQMRPAAGRITILTHSLKRKSEANYGPVLGTIVFARVAIAGQHARNQRYRLGERPVE